MAANTPAALAVTEQRNPASLELDTLDSLGIVSLMNAADAAVPAAVGQVLAPIAQAVDVTVARLERGGRLIYVGAGTSGRLGVLDAAECPPTFRTDPSLVVGLIAGGRDAMFHAVEGAEDSMDQGAADLRAISTGESDVVVGLAASGRTPYVLGALDSARSVGAATVAVTCNPGSVVGQRADIAIEMDNGPEILTGSSRLKSGTSQKLVLNMISTAVMVRLGKTYSNLMVDVAPTNSKLVDRAARIVVEATGAERAVAEDALARCGGHAKTAIVMVLCDVDADAACAKLDAAHGKVRDALEIGRAHV